MNFIDVLFAVPLIWYAYKGFSKGLIVELASFGALIVGIWLAVNFSWYTGNIIGGIFDINSEYISLIAFAITFIGVIFIIHVLSRVVTKALKKVALGWVNKLLGGVLALLKVAFIISVMINYYQKIDIRHLLISQKTKENSLLYNPLANLSPVIAPKLKDINTQLIEEHKSTKKSSSTSKSNVLSK